MNALEQLLALPERPSRAATVESEDEEVRPKKILNDSIIRTDVILETESATRRTF